MKKIEMENQLLDALELFTTSKEQKAFERNVIELMKNCGISAKIARCHLCNWPNGPTCKNCPFERNCKNIAARNYYKTILAKKMLQYPLIRTPMGMTYRPYRENREASYSYSEYWRYISRDDEVYCY